MPLVTGTLTDFTNTTLTSPRLTFTPSTPVTYSPVPAAYAPTQPGYLYSAKPILVYPASDGSFSANLFAGALGMPDSWYTIKIEWMDASGGYIGADYPAWQLRVNPAGGKVADMLLTPWNPTLAWYGPTGSEYPPGIPVASTLTLNTTTGSLYQWSN